MMSSLREFYILNIVYILPAQLNLVLYLTGVGKQTSLKQRLHRCEQKLFQRYTLVADEKFF